MTVTVLSSYSSLYYSIGCCCCWCRTSMMIYNIHAYEHHFPPHPHSSYEIVSVLYVESHHCLTVHEYVSFYSPSSSVCWRATLLERSAPILQYTMLPLLPRSKVHDRFSIVASWFHCFSLLTSPILPALWFRSSRSLLWFRSPCIIRMWFIPPAQNVSKSRFAAQPSCVQ